MPKCLSSLDSASNFTEAAFGPSRIRDSAYGCTRWEPTQIKWQRPVSEGGDHPEQRAQSQTMGNDLTTIIAV